MNMLNFRGGRCLYWKQWKKFKEVVPSYEILEKVLESFSFLASSKIYCPFGAKFSAELYHLQ